MLPYFLGCPSWSEAAWRGSLYSADMPAATGLATYCQVFNAVEGNTTFYARPAPAALSRWAEQMPAHVHCCAKLPGARRNQLALLWVPATDSSGEPAADRRPVPGDRR